jgi:uncharacterized protein YyaL (SSP411 family)
VPAGGYATTASSAYSRGVFKEPVRDVDENIAVARFANILECYSGAPGVRKIAQRAMRYLAAPQIANGLRLRTGILLADDELAHDPTHVTVVGYKDDASAQKLHSAALRYRSAYRRIDWWDKREGAMPNHDVRYPAFAQAAAFVCSGTTCSQPVFDSRELARALDLSSAME